MKKFTLKSILQLVRDKRGLSLIAIIIVGYCWYDTVTDYKQWENPGMVISSDAAAYYGYLPAAFIYHDLSMQFYDLHPEIKDRNGYIHMGNIKIVKMTMGVAYLYSPFFFMAHAMAGWLGYPQDGYSMPYEAAINLSGLFYALIAFFFLRVVLLKRFSDITVALTVLIIGIGSNLLVYTTYEGQMSHSFSFFVMAVFLYLVDKWYNKKSFWLAILIGIVSGTIVLIRPVNILICLMFIFWGIRDWKDLKPRIIEMLKDYKYLLVIVFFGLLMLVPQLLYWKHVTNEWVVYSYIDEDFLFMDPEILRGFFSYRAGWLLYSPLMALSLFGFFFLRKKCEDIKLGILIVFCLAVYITFSWWNWWYGGGFGCRPLVDYYALLAFSTASFVSIIMDKKLWLKISFVVLLTPFVYLNFFQSWQFGCTLIRWDGMTKELYWKVFLDRRFPDDYELLWYESGAGARHSTVHYERERQAEVERRKAEIEARQQNNTN